MKAGQLIGIPARRRCELELAIDDAVGLLFQKLNGLSGFSVTDAAAMLGEREAGRLQGDLCLADITGGPSTRSAGDAYFTEIAVVLIDLLDEYPEAREMLRGRTFFRQLN